MVRVVLDAAIQSLQCAGPGMVCIYVHGVVCSAAGESGMISELSLLGWRYVIVGGGGCSSIGGLAENAQCDARCIMLARSLGGGDGMQW